MIHYYTEIPGWFNRGDAGFYSWLVSQMPDKATIVEVGCWKGRSLSCLLVEARNSGKDLRIIGVDTFQGSKDELAQAEIARAEDLHAICIANATRADYPFEIVRGDSAGMAREIGPVEAVFLDGCHGYSALRADLWAWMPLASLWLSGHDVSLNSVKAALQDTLGKGNWATGMGDCWWKSQTPIVANT